MEISAISADLSTEPSSNDQLPRLPACRFCHLRKSKCDNARPECALCRKHGEACVTLGVDESEPVTRKFIGDLEQEIKSLERELATGNSNNSAATPCPLGTRLSEPRENRNPSSNQRSELNKSDAHSPSFVEGGGISFMRHFFADSGWRENNPTILQNLSRDPGPSEAGIKPNPLPPAGEARYIFDKYLNGHHVQNPFFLRRDVHSLYFRVFSPRNKGLGATALHEAESHDLFRVFMILAIGSVIPFRHRITHNHPYGYYLSAMKHLDDSLLSRGLESIQNLLLVGRFAIYHYIGTSIWEIIRLCMRMCIERNLHKPTFARQHPFLHEQLQRRVFWECYMIDRYSAITLDRPVAIAEKSVEVGFPADASDEEIDAAENSGSFPDLDSFSVATSQSLSSTRATTEMSVFFACVRLRQITFKIHSQFGDNTTNQDTRNGITASGIIYAKLDQLLSELQQWRASAPIFPHPRSLYENQKWYDLLYSRERLLLVRKGIDVIPKQHGRAPGDLLSLCLQIAVEVITCFCELFEDRKITFTRSYFQILFTAGLSVMYCLSVVKDLEAKTVRDGREAVTICEHALKQIGEELPDAKRYVAVFEALRGYFLRKCRQLQGDGNILSSNLPSATQQGEYHSGASLASEFPGGQSRSFDAHLYTGQNDGLATQSGLAFSQDPLASAETFPQTYPSSIPAPDVETGLASNAPLSADSILSWDIFGDDAIWNMEAGLHEYAYGDPPANLYPENFFDM